MSVEYIGGYYWSGALKTVEPHELNATLLTHLYYAFLSVNADGTFTIQQEDKGIEQAIVVWQLRHRVHVFFLFLIQGYVEELLKLKTVNPDLKLLFSIVDNNGSFSTVVANETLRQDLVEHALDIVTSHNYDGIDIDWEFPKDNDKVKVNAN